MNNQIAALRQRLKELTFAQVANTVARDENLIAFTESGTTQWNDEPGFEKKWLSLDRAARSKSEPNYKFYYGFAQSPNGTVYFSSKNHNHESDNYSGLRIASNQHVGSPPPRGAWIVGSVIGSARPNFHQWVRCTEQEKLFAEFMLSGKKTFSDYDRCCLCTNRHISEGVYTNRLANMASLLLGRDLNYFLGIRERHGGKHADDQVFEICVEFDQDMWQEYKAKSLAQNLTPDFKYSEFIPNPL